MTHGGCYNSDEISTITMFGQKKDIYGNVYSSRPRRRDLVIIVLVGSLLVGLGITAIVGMAHRSQTKDALATLVQYDDPLFTIKYPKSYTPSFESDIKTTFRPTDSQQSPENILVTSSYPYETGVTIDNVDKLFSLGKNDEDIKTQKTKINDVSVAIFTERAKDTQIKTAYFFYTNTTWQVSVTYSPGTILDTTADAIITSFQSKEIKERVIPEDELPARTSSMNPSFLAALGSTKELATSKLSHGLST